MCATMDFRQIYVFREVNTCADRMTNLSVKIRLNLFSILLYLTVLGWIFL